MAAVPEEWLTDILVSPSTYPRCTESPDALQAEFRSQTYCGPAGGAIYGVRIPLTFGEGVTVNMLHPEALPAYRVSPHRERVYELLHLRLDAIPSVITRHPRGNNTYCVNPFPQKWKDNILASTTTFTDCMPPGSITLSLALQTKSVKDSSRTYSLYLRESEIFIQASIPFPQDILKITFETVIPSNDPIYKELRERMEDIYRNMHVTIFVPQDILQQLRTEAPNFLI